MKRIAFVFLIILIAACSPCGDHVRNELRAPAYPLVTIDPFTSTWSAADNLYDAPTTHWAVAKNREGGKIDEPLPSDELEMFVRTNDYGTIYLNGVKVCDSGKTYQEAQEILAGVTLESLVVARRVYAAMIRKAELGQVDLSMFPMLSHANAVLDEGKDAQLPWEAFTFDQTK